jgi:hypothetical protein
LVIRFVLLLLLLLLLLMMMMMMMMDRPGQTTTSTQSLSQQRHSRSPSLTLNPPTHQHVLLRVTPHGHVLPHVLQYNVLQLPNMRVQRTA